MSFKSLMKQRYLNESETDVNEIKKNTYFIKQKPLRRPLGAFKPIILALSTIIIVVAVIIVVKPGILSNSAKSADSAPINGSSPDNNSSYYEDSQSKNKRDQTPDVPMYVDPSAEPNEDNEDDSVIVSDFESYKAAISNFEVKGEEVDESSFNSFDVAVIYPSAKGEFNFSLDSIEGSTINISGIKVDESESEYVYVIKIAKEKLTLENYKLKVDYK